MMKYQKAILIRQKLSNNLNSIIDDFNSSDSRIIKSFTYLKFIIKHKYYMSKFKKYLHTNKLKMFECRYLLPEIVILINQMKIFENMKNIKSDILYLEIFYDYMVEMLEIYSK